MLDTSKIIWYYCSKEDGMHIAGIYGCGNTDATKEQDHMPVFLIDFTISSYLKPRLYRFDQECDKLVITNFLTLTEEYATSTNQSLVWRSYSDKNNFSPDFPLSLLMMYNFDLEEYLKENLN